MTDFAAAILRVLRVFGPLSNAEVARRLRVSPRRTYRQLYLLYVTGYAVRPELAAWDISDKGRRWFAGQPNRPPELFQEAAP